MISVHSHGFDGTAADAGNAVAADETGDVCALGYFDATRDFDPGAGAFQLIGLGKGPEPSRR